MHAYATYSEDLIKTNITDPGYSIVKQLSAIFILQRHSSNPFWFKMSTLVKLDFRYFKRLSRLSSMPSNRNRDIALYM